MAKNTLDGTTEEEQAGLNTTLNRHHFESYLSAVDAIADEAIIRVDESGIETRAVDPANVAMVEASLGAGAFLDSLEGEHAFGVNTRRLTNLVQAAESGKASLAYDADTRKLDLGLGPYQYTHSSLKPDTVRQEPDLPEMDLGFVADINSDQLKTAIEFFDEFTTHVRVGFDPSERTFWMRADERTPRGDIGTDDGAFELGADELERVREYGKADSQFSLDYFRDIVEAIPENYPVTVRAGEEYPMILSYKIGWEETGPDGGVAHGEVRFLQAPRIQTA